MLYLLDININNLDRTKYSIEFLIGNTMIVTKEFLKSRNVPDVGSITITQRIISTNQSISQKRKFRISYFQKCYHLYNRNSNPSMTIYLNFIPNPCLD